MAKYSKKAAAKVERAMKKRKAGTLKSGSGQTVKSKKQAIAIGLSEARAEGKKVPPPKKSAKKTTKKSAKGSTTKAGRKAAKKTGKTSAKASTSKRKAAKKS